MVTIQRKSSSGSTSSKNSNSYWDPLCYFPEMQNTWNSENGNNELNQETRDLGFVGQTGAQPK